jgi:hypothetical protein
MNDVGPAEVGAVVGERDTEDGASVGASVGDIEGAFVGAMDVADVDPEV